VLQAQLPASDSVAGGSDLQHPFSVEHPSSPARAGSTWGWVKSSVAGATNVVAHAWNHRWDCERAEM
jgi:hypothetical protein